MFFTVEETNLMCCFDTSSRKRLIAEIKVDFLSKAKSLGRCPCGCRLRLFFCNSFTIFARTMPLIH